MAWEDLGPTGGVVWSDPTEWERRRTPEGCVICRAGSPLFVIAETEACWVTGEPDAALPGYICVTSKQHVNEPFDLAAEDQGRFWIDAMKVAQGIASVTQAIKMNYEIHGNTLPHLHLHLFPRYLGDPYVGGPVDPRRASFRRSPEDIERLRAAVLAALGE